MSKSSGPVKSGTVRARVDPALKAVAESILNDLGLSPSDAIRLFYKQVSILKGLPFPVCIPNEATRKALSDANAGRGTSYDSVDLMFEDIGVRRGKAR